MLKRAIVVGASSGIGAALVRRLAHAGYRVAAVARRAEALEAVCAGLDGEGLPGALAYTHDVRDTAAAPALFDRIVADLDGLDLIVYTAGIMPRIAPEQYDTEVDRAIIEVNLVGAMAWLNLAAKRFLVQKGGTIVGIGSVAGDRGRVGQPAYCTSKAALATYLEALRNRLSRHDVQVITIKPGPVRTPMTEGLEKLPMAIDAERCAERIHAAIARRAQTAYVPIQWMPIMAVIRSIPSVVFRRTDI